VSALRLRERGVNCVVVDAGSAPVSIWEVADAYGFFVLGRAAHAAALARAHDMEGRPSCLGWIVRREVLATIPPRNIEGTAYAGPVPLLGLEVDGPLDYIPADVSFLVGPGDSFQSSSGPALPWLRIERGSDDTNLSDLESGILGTLEDWAGPEDHRL
jgi:hypothetical protein